MLILKNFRWYRRLCGGDWYYYKLGKDTPNIELFATWVKGISPEKIDRDLATVIGEEHYVGHWWKRFLNT